MDKKSIYNDMDNRKRKQYDKISNWNTSSSKSIKTQTEESSFLFNSCSCHRKIFNSFTDNEVPRSYLKTDCIPPSASGMCVCPLCSQSQNNGYFHHYPLPCYAPHGHCGVSPLIPMQWFHPPFLNSSSFSNGLQSFISASKTSISSNRPTNSAHHGSSAQSVVDDENCNNVCSVYDFNNNGIKNKLLTSSIRSEPNVAKNNEDVTHLRNSSMKNLLGKIKLNKNTLTNLLNKNASKKIHFKSDTDIPLTTDLKVKKSDIVCDSYRYKATSNNAFDKIGSSVRCNNKGDYSRLKNNDKDVLKSPIYKYADIRIHELSSSLKNIKDNIYKLSTKASELNITDSDCDNDNYKKYFKSIYSEFHDEDLPDWSVDNASKRANDRINFNNDSNLNRDSIPSQRVKQNEILPLSNLSMVRKEGGELFTDQFLSGEKNRYSELSSCNNNMKRTVPLRDIPSALNQSKVFSCKSVKPLKIKSNRDSKDRITAHVIVPECSSIFKGADKNNKKNCLLTGNLSKKKLNSLSKRYANISFKANYDSFRDNDNFCIHDCEDNDCDVENEYSEIRIGKRSDEGEYASTAIYSCLDSNCEKTVSNNNNDYRDSDNVSDSQDYEEDDDHENSHVQGQELAPPMHRLNQDSTMNIEDWLEKNVETGGEQSQGVYQSLPSSRKRCHLNSLSNLEILSKISEEDEDKFSCISEGSEQAKSLLIRDKFFCSSNCGKYSKNSNVKNFGPCLLENSCLFNINDSNKGSNSDCLYRIEKKDGWLH